MGGAAELGVSFTGPDGAAAAHLSADLARVNARVKKLAADQSTDIAHRLEREGVRVVQRARSPRRATPGGRQHARGRQSSRSTRTPC